MVHYNDERDTADQGIDDGNGDDDDNDDITEGNITVILALLLNITSLLPRAMHLSGLDGFLPVFSSQDGIVFFLSSLPRWFHCSLPLPQMEEDLMMFLWWRLLVE